ncbi:MAG TPA: DUF3570 domain-containing protein [Opitutaceae bacterium]|jgi:hypothetical protein
MTPRLHPGTAWPVAIPLSLVLTLTLPRPSARADGSIAYRYENYEETGGRVIVQTQGVDMEQDLPGSFKFTASLVDDAITGASPTGAPAPAGSDQVPTSTLSDHRKAWDLGLARTFGPTNLAVGLAESREHDYVSRGWSLNTLTDFNQKNTTLIAGIAGHADDVETFYDPQFAYRPKHAVSAILGVTQLLDKWTSVTFDLSWGRETGFLNDQYKAVLKSLEIFPGVFLPLGYPENRPGERDSGTAYVLVDRAFPTLHGALELSYRFYADTYGIAAHTAEARWLQKVGEHLTIGPEVRAYEQGAARFYYYNLDDTSIQPTRVPDPNGTNYSSDYRLSSLETTTYGIRVSWKPVERLEFTAAYDRYRMHGRDGVTPQSAYPVANILSAGAKLSW